MAEPTSPLRVALAGHVDHGKSTLVGRLVHDTGSLPEGKLEAIRASSAKRGMPFEWAFLLDAFQAERDQGITIDTTQVWLKTKKRGYTLVDAPGHKEFLRNMVTGAAAADGALLVVDAKEGVREQSRRHAFLLGLLGLTQIVVAVNKMDLVGYDRARFTEVAHAIEAYLGSLGIAPKAVIPVSGREGDNIVGRSEAMVWYRGPTLVETIDGFQPLPSPVDQPLRFPIQDVYKFDERRIIAGRIESGRLKVGDTLAFAPGGRKARIASIEAWPENAKPSEAEAGRSIGVTLDDQIFVERGQIGHHEGSAPAETNSLRVRIVWLGREPLLRGKRYKLKLATAEHQVEVQTIERVIDTADLASRSAEAVVAGDIAEIVLRTRATLAVDDSKVLPRTGRFVLVDAYDVAGGGTVALDSHARVRREGIKSTNIKREEGRVALAERWQANGHKSGILWLTGLSGAGKSTLAVELEQHLFRKGWHVTVLDGDNIRHGLSADLGFSPEDRTENIRRIGEVAALFARAGMIVITAFISPYREDRDGARKIAPELFHEIHVKADLATCEQRDPKGHYKKARAGLIPEFTGISAPYEAPASPELVVDTAANSLEACLGQLTAYVERTLGS
ncbi:MAG: adenylyl-sulfate kinase [Alphaproteobacteria bacterium]|nr:adenylyl-sulfate kinase [Alphaproteobacteria bacterium]